MTEQELAINFYIAERNAHPKPSSELPRPIGHPAKVSRAVASLAVVFR